MALLKGLPKKLQLSSKFFLSNLIKCVIDVTISQSFVNPMGIVVSIFSRSGS